ncbi:MAG: NAD(+)/NADH kinase [Firmicutes bacterium]|nr:NAD(+)/NADH kinase [Bacillota bacterium]
MKKIGIFTNLSKDSSLVATKKLIDVLTKHDIDFYLYRNLENEFSAKEIANKVLKLGKNIEKKPEGSKIGFFNEENYNFLDLIITVGGDGTVLNIAKDCVKADIPMLAINRGTKGFLTEIEVDEIEKVIDVLNGNFVTDTRILISIELKGSHHIALNEAFVTRRASMIDLMAKVSGQVVDTYSCDGLLVATPTGSTAYSLSAGGPIIGPNASVMCITPVCSHNLRSRPIIVGDNETIEIALTQDHPDAILIVDGVEVDTLKMGDIITVKKSKQKLKFLRQTDSNFYSKLLNRLYGLV